MMITQDPIFQKSFFFLNSLIKYMLSSNLSSNINIFLHMTKKWQYTVNLKHDSGRLAHTLARYNYSILFVWKTNWCDHSPVHILKQILTVVTF